MNTVYIWLTNPSTPLLSPDLEAFKKLPTTIQWLLLNTNEKHTFAHKPVPTGNFSALHLMENLENYRVLDNASFKDKPICWIGKLLLHCHTVDDMMGFDNGKMMACGMCPPVTVQEFYQIEMGEHPTYFMRGKAAEIWGDDPFDCMTSTSENWDDVM